jgi:hypothetical protein
MYHVYMFCIITIYHYAIDLYKVKLPGLNLLLFVTGTGATIFFLGDLVFLATTLVPPMIWVSFVRTIA